MLEPSSAPYEQRFLDLLSPMTTTCRTVLKGPHTADPVRDFAVSVAAGLSRNPPQLECRFLYDRRGSELYEQITRQPEYYPTRTEAAILAEHAATIARLTGPLALAELGSGSSEKTDHLLRAYLEQGPVHYVPIDVSASALQAAGDQICDRHPGVRVIGLNATYQEALPLLRRTSPVMVIFLGSTIGNFDEAEAERFLELVSRSLPPGSFFLLGLDLVKEKEVLEAAYNDDAGVTAAFTRNLFARMNRELGSGIDLSKVEHRARYDIQGERIEIDALFTAETVIRVAPLERRFTLPAGTAVRTEISRKFRLEKMVPYLERFGLVERRIFTDAQKRFGLLLLQKGTVN